MTMVEERPLCDAGLRWNFIVVACELPSEHDGGRHEGHRESTLITWHDSDRRSFRGADPGPCPFQGCVLPRRHHGDHAL